jgi:hypothetical protein
LELPDCQEMAAMAKKKKQDRFNPVKEIKAMARERIGNPPTSRVVPDRKKKKRTTEKHKSTLGEMLEDV